MKKLLLVIFLFVAMGARAQQLHTVTIRPHFNGQENTLWHIDTTCYHHDVGDSIITHSNELACMAWTFNGCPGVVSHMMQLQQLTDTSLIPANAVITNATLYLYGLPSSPGISSGNSHYNSSLYPNSNEVVLRQVAYVDAIGRLNWNNQPAQDMSVSVVIPSSYEQFNENDTVDATALVADMVHKRNNVFAFSLRYSQVYSSRLWSTDNYADTSLHPMLVVSYDEPTAVTSVLEQKAEISLYPNPVQQQLNLHIVAAQPTHAIVSVHDITGRRLYSAPYELTSGANHIAVPTQDYAPGVYSVTVVYGTHICNQLFTKQ